MVLIKLIAHIGLCYLSTKQADFSSLWERTVFQRRQTITEQHCLGRKSTSTEVYNLYNFDPVKFTLFI